MPSPRSLGVAAALAACLAAAPAPARAAPPSAPPPPPTAPPPPSQRLSTDAPPPVPSLAATADALGPVFGRYLGRMTRALARWHALSLDLGAERRGDRWLARGWLGWQLWPLAGGLRGPWVGVAIGAAAAPASQEGGAVGWDLPVRLEAGLQGVWRGVAVGVSAGVEWPLVSSGLGGAARARGSIGLHVGWATL